METGASRRGGKGFDISARSAVEWLQRWNENRRCRAETARWKRLAVGTDVRTDIGFGRPNRPDLTLEETVAELRKRRIRTSNSALARFFERHDITFKKSAASGRAAARRVARARRRWIREQGMLDPARLVFIDETAVTTKMVRLWGRGPRGVGLIGRAPCGKWETITFVAALRHNKMVAPMVVEGAMNAETFLAYIEQCLVPTLTRSDIVVMDNVSVHKGPRIRQGNRERARGTALPAEVFARPQSHRNALQQIQDIPA